MARSTIKDKQIVDAVDSRLSNQISTIQTENTARDSNIAQNQSDISNIVADLDIKIKDSDGDTYIQYEESVSDNDQIDFFTGGKHKARIAEDFLLFREMESEKKVSLGFADIDFVNYPKFKLEYSSIDYTPVLSVLANGHSTTFINFVDYGDFKSIELPDFSGLYEYGRSSSRVLTVDENARLTSINLSAATTDFDNSNSSLEAVNTQEAIDVLALRGKTNRQNLTAPKTLTNQDPAIQHLTNQTGADLVVNLPATPIADRSYEIIQSIDSTSNLIVSGNGNSFNNKTTSQTILPEDNFEVVFDGVEWIIR